jgi:hypothetical protein
MVFAVTMASSASHTDEPLPDHDDVSQRPVGDGPRTDCDPVGSLFFDLQQSLNLRRTRIGARATDAQSDWALPTSSELTIRRGMLPSIDGQHPSHFSDIPTHSVNREAL